MNCLPSPKTFLRHVVMINYAGKVYVVIRGMEILEKSFDASLQSIIWLTYIICMALGMYWYTRFWLLKRDLDDFYAETSNHPLRFVPTSVTVLLAALYYAVFSVLFYQYVNNGLAFSIWNGWCAANLLLATPLFRCYRPPARRRRRFT